jgi:hypothetical protein
LSELGKNKLGEHKAPLALKYKNVQPLAGGVGSSPRRQSSKKKTNHCLGVLSSLAMANHDRKQKKKLVIFL